MNRICLVGRLTKEPQVKTVGASNTAVAEFGIAVNRIGKDAPSDFFNIKVWGKSADYCGQYLSKGQRVSVTGRMESREYEKDGVKRIIWDVIADQVNGLDKPGERGDDSPSKTSSNPADWQIDDPFA